MTLGGLVAVLVKKYKVNYFNNIMFCLLTLLIIVFANGCAKTNYEIENKPLNNCYENEHLSHANVGEILSFKFIVIDIKKESLHLEFINGMDGEFDALVVSVLAPLNWKGKKYLIHYQGNADYNDETLKIGDSFDFIVKIPECINQMWLFLPPWQSY